MLFSVECLCANYILHPGLHEVYNPLNESSALSAEEEHPAANKQPNTHIEAIIKVKILFILHLLPQGLRYPETNRIFRRFLWAQTK